MEEITFSIGNHGETGMSNLQVLLKMFEQLYGIHVRLDVIQYPAQRWPRLVEIALYRNGPDISEAGNSWVGDLIRMDALRPFSKEDVNEITGGAKYFDSVWQGSTRVEFGVPKIYSIPFSADARTIFYRRDILENAGIDETTAFQDFAHLEETLVKLEKMGVQMPLALPNRRSNVSLHNCASWVWAAGGDFLSPDGTSLAFTEPAALEGFKEYFRLVRHVVTKEGNLEEYDADDVFGDGKAAILMSGFWILSNKMAADVNNSLGVAPMPGIPFVGGGDLVIWNHSQHESASRKLIQFFHSKEAGKLIYPWFGLPISEEDWVNPPFNTKNYQVFKAAIQDGRGFPTARLWGLVEKRLTDTLADIWEEVLNVPAWKLDNIVETRLIDLASRLELSMRVH